MKDKKTKFCGRINKRSLRWIFSSRKKKVRMMLMLACYPETVEEYFQRTNKELVERAQMQRIARELAERSEEQRMQEARELDAFIERTDKKLAAMSEEERAELERRDEALWQRIKKAIEEENP